MKESIHKYFQVGTVQWMSHPPAKFELLASLKSLVCDDFFDAIEVTAIADDQTRKAAKEILEQSHMKVCFGAQPLLLGPKLNPNDIDEQGREMAESVLLKAVDEAEYLGAKGMAFLAGKWSAETKEQNYAQLLKTTRRVCDHARSKGMMVELEVFDFDMDKAALIGPAPYAALFAADMRKSHDNFGLLADLSHFPTTYESTRFVIQTLKPYITHLHIGNAVVEKGMDGYGDLHPCFGYPGGANDTGQLLEFFQVLREEGFFRADEPLVLSMEVQPRPGQDGDIILANTKRVINRAWVMLED